MKGKIKVFLVFLILIFITMTFFGCDFLNGSLFGKKTEKKMVKEKEDTNDISAGNDDPASIEHVHSYGEWVIVTPATCVERGTKERACSCGQSKQVERIPATGNHTFDENNICTVCGIELETEGLIYTLKDDDTYVVTGYQGKGGSIIIPSTHEGKRVTGIGSRIINDDQIGHSIYEVTIPSSIEYIDEEAFLYCIKLIHIINKSELEFDHLKMLFGFADESERDMIVDEMRVYGGFDTDIYETVSNKMDFTYELRIDDFGVAILTYNDKIFLWGYCGEEQDLDLSSYVFTDTAFGLIYNNKIIKSIRLPDGLLRINGAGFQECDSIETIIIPDSVMSIGIGAFSGCAKLNNINIPDGITAIGMETFYNCHGLENIVIPDSVTSIGSRAFNNCYSLRNITIGANVTDIDVDSWSYNSVFYGCFRLVEVYNRSSLNITAGSTDYGYVGYYAKAVYTQPYESKITIDDDGYILYTDENTVTLLGHIGTKGKLIFPQGITHINQYAFYQDYSLFSVTIPSSVIEIGDSAFNACIKLVEIHNESSLPITQGDYSSCGGIGYYAKNIYKEGQEKLIMDDGYALYVDGEDILLIGYAGTKTDLVFPEGITEIGSCAFLSDKTIRNITIPDSVKVIGKNAFQYSTVKNVCFGTDSRLTTIMSDAFWNCNELTEISLPLSVINIEYNAFGACNKLTTVYMPSVSHIGERAFEYSRAIKYFVIPGDVTAISNRLFSECKMLENVTMPGSITTIGYSAFYNCEKLTNIMFLGTKEQWNAIEKSDNWNTGVERYTVHCTDGDLTEEGHIHVYVEQIIPPTCTDYGYLEKRCECGSYSRTGSGSPLGHDFVDGVCTRCGSLLFEYTLIDDDTYGLSACNGDSSEIIIPDSYNGKPVTRILRYAVYNLSDLHSVTIPYTIVSIEHSAFGWCYDLTEIFFIGTVEQWNAIEKAGDWDYNTGMYTVHCIDGDVEKHIHDHTLITVPATCTEEGYQAYACEGCGAIDYYVEWYSPLEHDYVNNVCTRCGGIGPHEHVYDEGVVTEPTCGERGYTTYTCTICGEFYQSNWKQATGAHTFVDDTCAECGIDISLLWYKLKDDETYEVSGYDVTHVFDNVIIPSVYKGKAVTSIGSAAFDSCTMTNVVIPDSVEYIDICAFHSSRLISITLGSDLISIGEWAFGSCYFLVEIYNRSSLDLKSENDYGVGVTNARNIYTIEGGSKLHTDDDGFIIYIDDEDISIVGYVGTNTQLTLPDGITEINQYAFTGNSAITSITIPDSVTSIGEFALGYCHSLTSITFKGTMAQWDAVSKESNWDSSAGMYTVYCTDSDVEKHIHDYTLITVPATCTEEGYQAYACEGCGAIDYYVEWYSPLEHDYVNNVCTRCGQEYYTDGLYFSLKSDNTYEIIEYTGTNNSVIIPTEFRSIPITSIGYRAFYELNHLTNITIPACITQIGAEAFWGCQYLNSVYYLGDVNSWCEISFNGAGYETGNPLFYAQNLYINECLVTNLIIPETVFELKDHVFSSWSGTSVFISNGVTRIGGGAFGFCGNLLSITIPDSVLSFGSQIFMYCDSLKDIYYLGTMAQWNAIQKDNYWYDGIYGYTVHCTDGDFCE